MTYQEVAQGIINLYTDYVETCAVNDENYSDYSEEVVTAIEALLIRADNERMIATQKEYLTNLCGIAPIPSDGTIELLKQEDAFDKHFKLDNL